MRGAPMVRMRRKSRDGDVGAPPCPTHPWLRSLAAGMTALSALLVISPDLAARAPPGPRPNASAAPAPAPAPAPGDEADVEAADSPRASVRRFLALGDQKRWAEAAEYIDVPRGDGARGAELANELHAVITQHVVVDPDELSPDSKGAKDDGLPTDVDELGVLDDAEGRPVHIRLVRRGGRSNEEGARWVFSKGTLAYVDALHADLEEPWAREHMPAPLLRRGPKGVRYWQIIAVPLLVVVCVVLAYALTRLGVIAARRAFDERGWIYRMLSRLERPVRVAWALVVFQVLLPHLALPAKVHDVADRLLAALTYLAIFWAILRAVTVFGDDLVDSAWAKERPTLQSLTHVGVRFSKVVVTALALLVALSRLGYPVTSVVAGFGLGGVVLALAAQKTVENLFGTISILVDQAFRVGDVIRVDEVQGAVESIGLRSTRIRRIDGVLVIFPNGLLADQRIESLSERDTIRLTTRLPVFRGEGASDVRALRAAVRAALVAHPMVVDRDLSIDLCSIEESWFEIEIAVFVATRSAAEFERVRGELLEACIDAATRSGTRIALPSRAVIAPG